MSTSHFWYSRLFHCNKEVMSQVLSLLKIKDKSLSSIANCNACCMNKAKKLPFSRSTSHAKKPLHIVHIDIWGPCLVDSNFCYKYYLPLVDEYTRYTWVIPLTHQSDTLNVFL